MPNNSEKTTSASREREFQIQSNHKMLAARSSPLPTQHYLDTTLGEPKPHVPTPPPFEFYAIFYHTNPILDEMQKNKLNLQFTVRQMLIQEYNNSLKNNAL
jgi:hypothetical protein